jgi:uncharacterized Zn finger protein (UPF0148 family)
MRFMTRKGKLSCPNCGSSLMSFNPWLGQMWTCQHCGYRGPVELVEDGKQSEKDKKLLEDIKEELKEEKPRAAKKGSKKYVVMGLAVMILFLMLGPSYGILGAMFLLLYYLIDYLKG